MLFTSRSVADCLRTTPRAPRRMARTTSRSSSAAVNTITRVGSVSKLTSSRTARPSLSGMRRSSKRISGLSLARSLMHSAPFCASPTIVMSSSASRSLRRPSRKIAWSSASRTRICCLVLAMLTERDFDGQSRSMARVRLNGQNAPHSTRTLLDGNRTQSQAVELIPGKPARKAKTLAVVVHHEDDATVILRQFYHDMGSLRMLFYVVECFTVNLENLAADAVGRMEVGGLDHDVQGQSGFVAIAFRETVHKVNEVGALDAQGAQVGDHAAELGGLVFDGLLEVAEAGDGMVGSGGDPAAEDVELYFDAEEGLENAIVEVAGDAAALAFDGAGAEMAQQEDVFKRRTDVAGDALEPGEVGALEGLAAVD